MRKYDSSFTVGFRADLWTELRERGDRTPKEAFVRLTFYLCAIKLIFLDPGYVVVLLSQGLQNIYDVVAYEKPSNVPEEI